jgi:steroid delta-isomerase
MPDPATLRATIDNYAERFSAGDRDGWVDLFTADARQEDPVGTPVNIGHEAIGGFYDNMVGGFGVPRLALSAEPIIVGNEAMVELNVVAGSGEGRVRIPRIIDHMTFADDGRISSLRAFWDPTTIVPDPE